MDPQNPNVSFNSEVLSPSATSINAIASAALYGRGIFTTIAIYDSNPFLWKKHWRRLSENAVRLNIDLSEFSEESTRKALDEVLDKNRVIDGRARITFFDESASPIWRFQSDRKASLLITTADRKPARPNFRIKMSPNRASSLSKLAAIKSCNYLDNLLAFEDAGRSGFNEAIRLNERDEVVSACMANVFWLKNARLFTPSLKTGCLPGTTREFILESLECEEVAESETEINSADAVFLASAGVGVIRVEELDGRKLKAADHPILHLVPAFS